MSIRGASWKSEFDGKIKSDIYDLEMIIKLLMRVQRDAKKFIQLIGPDDEILIHLDKTATALQENNCLEMGKWLFPGKTIIVIRENLDMKITVKKNRGKA